MVTCGAFLNPLELDCIFVNYLSGSMDIFVYLALFAIVIMGAAFRMSFAAVGSIVVLFALVMYEPANWFVYVVGVVAALCIGAILTRLGTRT